MRSITRNESERKRHFYYSSTSPPLTWQTHNTSFIHSFPAKFKRVKEKEGVLVHVRFPWKSVLTRFGVFVYYIYICKKIKKNISQFELVMVMLGKGNACLFQSSNVRSNNWSLCSKLLLRLRSNLLFFFYYSFFMAILFATPIIIWCFGFTGSVFSL